METGSMQQFNNRGSKRTFLGRRYLIIGNFIIEYGWHLSEFGYSFVIKEKTEKGWRIMASTYPDLHPDFQSAADYLFWYTDASKAIMK
jgi:hypothetical protein